jgi:HAD superfamily hydrolase (TIGR01509 family)
LSWAAGPAAERQKGYTAQLKNSRSAVIFDMDGLLIDSEPLYKCAWQSAASNLGFHLPDEAYFSLLGLTDNAAEVAILEMFGDGFPLSSFRDCWKRIWVDLVADGELQPKMGAAELLLALRSGGIPMALATSSGRDHASESLERTGLAEYFNHVLTGEDVANGKPAPDLFQLAASRIGVSPNQCLVLEDSPAGVEAGLAAGMAVIVVPDLFDPPEDCANRAQLVVANLEEAKPYVLSAVGIDEPSLRKVEH